MVRIHRKSNLSIFQIGLVKIINLKNKKFTLQVKRRKDVSIKMEMIMD